MLTDQYLKGIPADSPRRPRRRAAAGFITEDNLARIRGLDEIARRRGQSLAQMALAWVLRDGA